MIDVDLPTPDDGTGTTGTPGPDWADKLNVAMLSLAAATGPALHQQDVTGVVSISVVHEALYELTGTGAATVTLTGAVGCQVAVRWAGVAGTVQGRAMAAGEGYGCWGGGHVRTVVGGVAGVLVAAEAADVDRLGGG